MHFSPSEWQLHTAFAQHKYAPGSATHRECQQLLHGPVMHL